MSFRLPGEWEPHERTLMAWPLHLPRVRHIEGAGKACAGPADSVAEFEPPTMLVGSASMVGTGGYETDDEAIEVLGQAFPGSEVVAVPGVMFSYGGGGPHCSTMQIPESGGAS